MSAFRIATTTLRQATRAARPQAAALLFTPSSRFALSTSAIHRSDIPGAPGSAQHPGKSDIDHLENPSASEEAVHADRETADPLSAASKASHKIEDAASAVADAAKSANKAKATAQKVVDSVKDTIGGGSKRSYHSSAVRRSDVPGAPGSAQHPGKSGHDHLDNPSASEETVHADRAGHDPLPHEHKSSTKEKAKESAGVKENVSELKKKEVDDLPDGEATLKSMGGGK
ncbi:hypothetical protein JCM10207_009198 [Rhodosporidiobolus poonsookiae]